MSEKYVCTILGEFSKLDLRKKKNCLHCFHVRCFPFLQFWEASNKLVSREGRENTATAQIAEKSFPEFPEFPEFRIRLVYNLESDKYQNEETMTMMSNDNDIRLHSQRLVT